MKASLFPILALAVLALASCGKRSSSRIVYEVRDEAVETVPVVATSDRPNDREPIPSTAPPGSSMDPSSNAYVIFDGSGSMAGTPVEEARRAVSSFIAGAPEDLNIGLFVFDQDHQGGAELVPLGRGESQRQQLQQAVSKIRAGGGTPLGAAIQAGTNSLIQQFQQQLRYGDIRLIVVTDGEATDGNTFHRSIDHARKNHVPIYTIGFRIRNTHPLRQFSEAYLTARDETELLNAMRETLAELDGDVDL
jgi:Mg-chelatase subunit ChlD